MLFGSDTKVALVPFLRSPKVAVLRLFSGELLWAVVSHKCSFRETQGEDRWTPSSRAVTPDCPVCKLHMEKLETVSWSTRAHDSGSRPSVCHPLLWKPRPDFSLSRLQGRAQTSYLGFPLCSTRGSPGAPGGGRSGQAAGSHRRWASARPYWEEEFRPGPALLLWLHRTCFSCLFRR